MGRILDIAPLRSFVAVADAGGFQRAADVLHLTQGAVSQHVRRLEAATGRPLVQRAGRGFQFTAAGEQLLGHARGILDLHDKALGSLRDDPAETVVIGSTEHAAAQLLPHLTDSLGRSLPRHGIRFRIDRGTKLRDGFAAGRIDIALLIGPADSDAATTVGDLELTWYSAPGWTRPAGPQPLPVVALDDPCALRTRALETLAAHSIPVAITAESRQLAGVHAAVSAGAGVALLATLGQTPQGLQPRDDLPRPEPLPLTVWSRRDLQPAVTRNVTGALRRLLGTGPADGAPTRQLTLIKGA